MKNLKEFTIGGKGTQGICKLIADFMSKEDYIKAHRNLVIPCHDVYIAIPNERAERGLLLVRRKQEPAKGQIWPSGGRILRGTLIEDSLRKRVREECNLGLENITYLGVARLFSQQDPFGHMAGTDNFGFNYYAEGIGKLKLDAVHRDPIVITPDQYINDFKQTLHPYVREFMNNAMSLLQNSQKQ